MSTSIWEEADYEEGNSGNSINNGMSITEVYLRIRQRYLISSDDHHPRDNDDHLNQQEDLLLTSNNDKSIQPLYRTYGLDSDDSRYKHALAAPSDETLRIMWTAWAVIALSVGIFSLLVFLGILSNRRARNNSFNTYILCLAFPDWFFSFACGTTCLMNAINGAYWSQSMCSFQQFYITFGIAANTWLNAVLTYQLHKMLRFSHQRRRYMPPTRKQVLLQSICVYLYSAFLGCWGFIHASWFPYKTYTSKGLACIAVETDRASTIFFYVCYIPLFIGIPIVYIIFVCIDIYRRKLLPPTDKRRMFIYYGRIILVFFLMWFPTLILAFIASSWMGPWGMWAGGAFSHLQAGTSAAVSMMKPDIQLAVTEFVCFKSTWSAWCCRLCNNNNNNNNNIKSNEKDGIGNNNNAAIIEEQNSLSAEDATSSSGRNNGRVTSAPEAYPVVRRPSFSWSSSKDWTPWYSSFSSSRRFSRSTSATATGGAPGGGSLALTTLEAAARIVRDQDDDDEEEGRIEDIIGQTNILGRRLGIEEHSMPLRCSSIIHEGEEETSTSHNECSTSLYLNATKSSIDDHDHDGSSNKSSPIQKDYIHNSNNHTTRISSPPSSPKDGLHFKIVSSDSKDNDDDDDDDNE